VAIVHSGQIKMLDLTRPLEPVPAPFRPSVLGPGGIRMMLIGSVAYLVGRLLGVSLD